MGPRIGIRFASTSFLIRGYDQTSQGGLSTTMWHECHRPSELGSAYRRLAVVLLLLGCLPLVEAYATDVSPSVLTFKAMEGSATPPAQGVTVSKKSKRSLEWTTSTSASWLSVAPSSGTLSTSSELSVSVNPAGLAAGTYTATVQMTVEKGGNASIPVTFTIEPSGPSVGKAVTLRWDPNIEVDLMGYKVYVGTKSGSFGPSIDVGNVTAHSLTNLQKGSTYYFVVTAYDKSGNESLPSNEVSTSLY